MRSQVALASLLLVIGGGPRAWAMTQLEMCELRPAFMEDFQTVDVAPHVLSGSARWIAHTPWNGDFGDAAFGDPGPGGPFAISDGSFTITARQNAAHHWTSGLIAAADATGHGHGVRYGYFEARMKLPAGPGTWPAFWLGALNQPGDKSPSVEIDAIEYYGHDPGGFQTAVGVWTNGKNKGAKQWNLVPSGSLVAQFHDYGVRVAPDVITFYLDRVPLWEVATPRQHTKPLYPIVDLALGSGYPISATPNPSVLRVEYVHVYTLDPHDRTLDPHDRSSSCSKVRR